MNNHLSYLLQHRHRRRKGDTAKLAESLAPLEEQYHSGARQNGEVPGQPMVHQEAGAIVVEANGVDLSKQLGDASESTGRKTLEPVVIVIVVVMLSFIAFIAWQISLMTEQ